jgi:hypothetical protein
VWHNPVGVATPRSAACVRTKLDALQTDPRNYTRLRANLADVEDLTDLEAV